jgi:hypothetical protein
MEEDHPNAAVQIWPSGKAPADLCLLLDGRITFDWVAYVPKSLNDPAVIALLTGSAPESQYLQRVELTDGGLLLAGPSPDRSQAAAAHAGGQYSGQRTL